MQLYWIMMDFMKCGISERSRLSRIICRLDTDRPRKSSFFFRFEYLQYFTSIYGHLIRAVISFLFCNCLSCVCVYITLIITISVHSLSTRIVHHPIKLDAWKTISNRTTHHNTKIAMKIHIWERCIINANITMEKPTEWSATTESRKNTHTHTLIRV